MNGTGAARVGARLVIGRGLWESSMECAVALADHNRERDDGCAQAVTEPS